MPVKKGRELRLELLHRAFVEAREKGLLRADIVKMYEREDHNVASSTLTEDLNELERVLQERNEVEAEYAIIVNKLPGPGNPQHYRYSSLGLRLYESEKSLSMEQKLEMERIIDALSGFGDYAVLQEVIPQLQSMVQLKKHGQEHEPRKIIEPEFNLGYVGREYVPFLFNAIHNCQELQIDYRPFEGESAIEVCYPLYLKQFNQRWFLVVQKANNTNETQHYSLDRIEKVKVTGQHFFYPTHFDSEVYFEDVIGVTVNPGPVETIKFRVKKPRAYYISTKPIHLSQKQLKENRDPNESFLYFHISVIPNKELYATFLEFGPDLEVLSPNSVRDALKEMIVNMYDLYTQSKTQD
jgi:predicted DNA-binding transcriptional regulator YafY